MIPVFAAARPMAQMTTDSGIYILMRDANVLGEHET